MQINRSFALALLGLVTLTNLALADAPKYEAAVVEKTNENKVEYKEIFKDGKRLVVLEEKQFKVRIQMISVLNPRTRTSYHQLEITVTDIDDETKVLAYQRQYSDSQENMNNLVMQFVHPRTGDSYVVGFRSAAGTQRLFPR